MSYLNFLEVRLSGALCDEVVCQERRTSGQSRHLGLRGRWRARRRRPGGQRWSHVDRGRRRARATRFSAAAEGLAGEGSGPARSPAPTPAVRRRHVGRRAAWSDSLETNGGARVRCCRTCARETGLGFLTATLKKLSAAGVSLVPRGPEPWGRGLLGSCPQSTPPFSHGPCGGWDGTVPSCKRLHPAERLTEAAEPGPDTRVHRLVDSPTAAPGLEGGRCPDGRQHRRLALCHLRNPGL